MNADGRDKSTVHERLRPAPAGQTHSSQTLARRFGDRVERVLPSEDNVQVGSYVTLIADEAAFRRAFNTVGYRWDDAMVALLGQTVEVVRRRGPGIFGLPESAARSGQPVWFYPFSVIVSVQGTGEASGEQATPRRYVYGWYSALLVTTPPTHLPPPYHPTTPPPHPAEEVV